MMDPSTTRLDRAALDLLPMGVVHIDGVGTVQWVNRMMADMVDADPAELIGRNLLEFASGDLDRYGEMLDFGVGFTRTVMGPLTVDFRDVHGTVHHGTLWGRNHLADPDVGSIVCVVVPDSTDRWASDALAAVAAHEPVEVTLALLAEAVRGHPFEATGCWLLRDRGGRRLVSDRALGDEMRTALEAPGCWWDATDGGALRSCDDTTTGGSDDRRLAAAGVAAWWARPCQRGDGIDAALLVLRRSPGPISPNQIEHLERLTTTATLAFERASMQARLAHAAFHDPLTGLANRTQFFDRGGADDAGAALLSVDLDHFKPVNDRYGHAAGDEVLVTIAERIQGAVRPTDHLSRFGGDEFVVECPGVVSDTEAIEIAERIIAVVERPIPLDTATVTVSASVGIALTDAGVDVDALLDRSDAALLAAKAAGKGRWAMAGPLSA